MPRVIATPTDHEKAEWSRLAKDAYSRGRNEIGHRYSAAASLPKGAEMPSPRFTSLMRDYQAWLVDGFDSAFGRINPRKRGKLTGAAKTAFLARMAKGRKKNPAKFKAGQHVTTSGYPGRVVRMYSPGMVEVRLKSGVTVVPVGDVKRLKRTRVANPKRGPRGEVNSAEAKELELYAQNESALYSQKQAIIKNIQRRLKKGTYDATKAVRLWRYWIDNAATRYRREFSMTGGFNVPTRDAAARAVSAYEIERIRGNEYNENPGKRRHSKKFDRCVRKLKRSRRVSNAYAVCTATFERKRIRRKNAKGVVICVYIAHKYYYYTKGNILSTNQATAKRFGTVRAAAAVARHISRAVPTNAQVSIHSA